MNKLAVLLIDGMDPELVEKFSDKLPNFKKIISQGTFKKLESVLPPDSIPAWATIYTGLTPGEHGIFESIDYLKIKNQNVSMDNNVFKGKTFWDKISNDGYQVGIINPFIAFPSWDVNGYMVSGPVFESGNVSSNKEEILQDYDIPPLGGIVDYPSVNSYHEFLDDSLDLLRKQNDLAIKLFKSEKTSFFFYGNLIMDRIKHFYWKFSENHKTKDISLKNAILKTYHEFDLFIERLNNESNNEFDFLIISDHGHQKRVTKTFCINEWLRKNGYIKTKFGLKTIIEKCKNTVLSLLDVFGCIDLSLKLSKIIPKANKLKSSEYINSSKSDIYVPKFAGMNPYGGICFNLQKISPQIINEIKEKLCNVTDRKTGERVIEWVEDREKLYKGKYIDIFPNIIFKLNNNYGINRSFYTGGIIGKNHFYSRISGGHRRDGVFLYSKKIDNLKNKEKINIEQVHDIILNLFYGREAC